MNGAGLEELSELEQLFAATQGDSARVEAVAREYLAARSAKECAADVAKAANERETAAKLALLDALAAAGLSRVGIAGGPTITAATKTHFKLPPKSRPADLHDALAWLKNNGLDALVEETANHQSLGAALRDLLEDGVEIPALFERFDERTISVRK